MIRKHALVLPAILLSLTLLAACGDNPTPQVAVVTATPAPTAQVATLTTAPATTQAAIVKEVGKLGQPMSLGGYTLTVNSVEKTATYDGSKPTDGYNFMVLDVTIASDKEEGFDVSKFHFYLLSQTGLSYYYFTNGGKKPSLSDLPKSQTMRGWVTFGLPNDVHSLLLECRLGFEDTDILVDPGF